MKIFRVGGSVRDYLLGKNPHDIDYVVVGATPEEMISKGFVSVGKDFPVFLHPDSKEEYALARKEIKTGNKHTDFSFSFTPDTTLEDDLIRRDFTINALCQDVETGEIIDYHNGMKDLGLGIIRHISDHFIEDPLRILRAIRFTVQLNFELAPETKELCSQMVAQGELNNLTPERIWKEIEKALHCQRFDRFISGLDEIGALQVIFPEVYNLKEVPENIIYHPEGNSYKHTLLSLENPDLANPDELALINFALLCHDLGKQLTDKDKWPAHHDHEYLGLDLVNNICDRLLVPNVYRNFALLFMNNHMKLYNYEELQLKTRYDMMDRLTKFKSENARILEMVIKAHACDMLGRDEEEPHIERLNTFLRTANLLYQDFNSLMDKNLEDMPIHDQEMLSRHTGKKFGELYRCVRINYMREVLNGLQGRV